MVVTILKCKEVIVIENFKKVNAPIIGANGNVFNLIGICRRELKKSGYYKEAEELGKRVTECQSYEEALNLMMEYVNPISEYDMEIDDYSDIDI